MKKYKYIHLFLHDSLFFNSSFCELISENFNKNDHLFVFRYQDNITGELSLSKCNIVIDSSIECVNRLQKYSEIGDILLIHNLCYSFQEIAKMNSEVAKKVVWVVWGGDLYRLPDNQNFCYFVAHTLYRTLKGYYYSKFKALSIVRQFKGITAIFHGDRKYLIEKYKYKGPIFDAGYTLGYDRRDIDKWIPDTKMNNKKTIMIGHSGFPYLNQKKFIRILSKYKDDVRLILPLNYGDEKYIKMLKEYIKTLDHCCEIKIIENRMTAKEYCKLLNQVDVAIFDCLQQAALGNIFTLMYLGKKIFLNEKGLLYKGFTDAGLIVYKTSDIAGLSIGSLLSTEDYSRNKDYAANIMDKNTLIEKWDRLFKNILDER